MTKLDLVLRCMDSSTYRSQQITYIIDHKNRFKENHKIISNRHIKHLWQNPSCLHDKSYRKVKTRGNIPQQTKNHI